MERNLTEKEIFLLIRELVKVLRIFQNEKAICEDLTFSQFCILDFILEKGELPLAELHDLLSVEKSTTTRMVEPLVKKKFIKRDRCSFDSRAVNLTITARGEEAYNKVWECISQFTRQLMQQMPLEERQWIISGLKMFIQSFTECCK